MTDAKLDPAALAERLEQRIALLKNRGADVCPEFVQPANGDVSCTRCGYQSDVHLVRDAAAALRQRPQDGDLRKAVELGLTALPDGEGPDGNGYKYAWDECTTAEQDWVKHVRMKMSEALAVREARNESRLSLEDCYMLARRHIARQYEQTDKEHREDWAHIVRFCERAGLKSYIVRSTQTTQEK